MVDAVDTVTAKIELVMKCKEKKCSDHQQYGSRKQAGCKCIPCSRYLQNESLPTGESDASGAEKAWREEIESRLLRGQPTRPLEDMSISCRTNCICPPGAEHKCTERRDIPGSVAFVPSVAGLIIAGEVIKDLAQVSKK